MSSELEIQAADLFKSSMAQSGSIILTDTTSVTGKFRAIQVLANAAFTTLTSDITKNGIVTASVAADFGTVSAGTMLYGKFTVVKLTSGTVILYK